MLYFDSSLVVCLLSREQRTETLQLWFSTLDPDRLAMSVWNITEFHSAMSFKRRTGQIAGEQRVRAEAVFDIYLRNYFALLVVTDQHFRRAAAIAGRDDINIRAADALHLAAAETEAATLCTLDRKMQIAADVLGIDCFMP